jgi:hypothetical protein
VGIKERETNETLHSWTEKPDHAPSQSAIARHTFLYPILVAVTFARACVGSSYHARQVTPKEKQMIATIIIFLLWVVVGIWALLVLATEEKRRK